MPRKKRGRKNIKSKAADEESEDTVTTTEEPQSSDLEQSKSEELDLSPIVRRSSRLSKRLQADVSSEESLERDGGSARKKAKIEPKSSDGLSDTSENAAETNTKCENLTPVRISPRKRKIKSYRDTNDDKDTQEANTGEDSVGDEKINISLADTSAEKNRQTDKNEVHMTNLSIESEFGNSTKNEDEDIANELEKEIIENKTDNEESEDASISDKNEASNTGNIKGADTAVKVIEYPTIKDTSNENSVPESWVDKNKSSEINVDTDSPKRKSIDKDTEDLIPLTEMSHEEHTSVGENKTEVDVTRPLVETTVIWSYKGDTSMNTSAFTEPKNMGKDTIKEESKSHDDTSESTVLKISKMVSKSKGGNEGGKSITLRVFNSPKKGKKSKFGSPPKSIEETDITTAEYVSDIQDTRATLKDAESSKKDLAEPGDNQENSSKLDIKGELKDQEKSSKDDIRDKPDDNQENSSKHDTKGELKDQEKSSKDDIRDKPDDNQENSSKHDIMVELKDQENCSKVDIKSEPEENQENSWKDDGMVEQEDQENSSKDDIRDKPDQNQENSSKVAIKSEPVDNQENSSKDDITSELANNQDSSMSDMSAKKSGTQKMRTNNTFEGFNTLYKELECNSSDESKTKSPQPGSVSEDSNKSPVKEKIKLPTREESNKPTDKEKHRIPGRSFMIGVKGGQSLSKKTLFDCVLCWDTKLTSAINGESIKQHIRSRQHALRVMEVENVDLFNKYNDNKTATDNEIITAILAYEETIPEQSLVLAFPATHDKKREELKKRIIFLKEKNSSKISASPVTTSTPVSTTSISSTTIVSSRSTTTTTTVSTTSSKTTSISDPNTKPYIFTASLPATLKKNLASSKHVATTTKPSTMSASNFSACLPPALMNRLTSDGSIATMSASNFSACLPPALMNRLTSDGSIATTTSSTMSKSTSTTTGTTTTTDGTSTDAQKDSDQFSMAQLRELSLHIAARQKKRTPSQICVVMDERNKLLDPKQLGANVQVIQIEDLDFDNVYTQLKKEKCFNKGYLFIFLLGTFSIVKPKPNFCCKKYSCKNPVKTYFLKKNVTTDFLIRKALNLHYLIMSNTLNDLAIFSDILPIDIDKSNSALLEMRLCFDAHKTDLLRKVPRYLIKDYLNVVKTYNSFMEVHNTNVGYSFSTLPRNTFSDDDLGMALVQAGSDGISPEDKTYQRVQATIIENVHKFNRKIVTSLPKSQDKLSEARKKISEQERVISELNKVVKEQTNKLTGQEKKTSEAVPRLPKTVPDTSPDKGSSEPFAHVIIMGNIIYRSILEELKGPKVKILSDNELSCDSIKNLIHTKSPTNPYRTLWIALTGSFCICDETVLDKCSIDKCPVPLSGLQPSPDVLNLAGALDTINNIRKSCVGLMTVIRANLREGDSFLMIPPFPPTVYSKEKFLHNVLHSRRTGPDRVYVAPEHTVDYLNRVFTHFSKEMISLFIEELGRLNLPQKPILDYIANMPDNHLHVVRLLSEAKNEMFEMWLTSIKELIRQLLSSPDERTSNVKARVQQPAVSTPEITEPAKSNTPTVAIQPKTVPLKSTVTSTTTTAPSVEPKYDHLILIGISEQLKQINVTGGKEVHMWNLEFPLNQFNIKTKLSSLNSVSSEKKLFSIVVDVSVIGNRAIDKQCQTLSCGEPLSYVKSTSTYLELQALIQRLISSIAKLSSTIKSHFPHNTDVILLPLGFRYIIQKPAYNLSTHQALHQALKHASSPYICEGSRHTLENTFHRFKKQWNSVVKTCLKQTKASFADLILKHIGKQKPMFEWRTYVKSSLDVRSVHESNSKLFLQNFINDIDIQASQSVIETPQPETKKPIDTSLATAKSSYLNIPLPTLPPQPPAGANQKPPSCSKPVDTTTSISNSMMDVENSEIFTKSLKELSSVEAKCGDSFRHAFIVGNKKVIEPLSHLELKNVRFIYEDLSSVMDTDVPVLLGKMRNKSGQSEKLKNSICILACELSIITKTVLMSTGCSRFRCKQSVPINSLKVDGELSTQKSNAVIVKRIKELKSFVTSLSKFIPAVILPLYPSRVFCDDLSTLSKHLIVHTIKDQDCSIVLGTATEWERHCSIVSRLWNNFLNITNGNYVSSVLIEKYTNAQKNVFPIKTYANEFFVHSPESDVWKAFVQTVLQTLLANKASLTQPGKATPTKEQDQSRDEKGNEKPPLPKSLKTEVVSETLRVTEAPYAPQDDGLGKQFGQVVLLSDTVYYDTLKEFAGHQVEILANNNISCQSITDLIHENSKNLPTKTLWLTLAGTFSLFDVDKLEKCVRETCSTPLTFLQPSSSLFNLAASLDAIKKCRYYYASLMTEIRGNLREGDSFLMIPPFPPTVFSRERFLHNVLHSHHRGRNKVCVASDDKVEYLNKVFTHFSKEMISLFIEELGRLNYPQKPILNYIANMPDNHLHVVRLLSEAKNEMFEKWQTAISGLIKELLNDPYGAISPPKSVPLLSIDAVKSNASAVNSQTMHLASDSTLSTKTTGRFVEPSYHHLLFIGCSEQLKHLNVTERKNVHLWNLKFPLNWSDMKVKLSSLNSISSGRKVFVILADVSFIGIGVFDAQCQSLSCSEPLSYLTAGTSSFSDLIEEKIDSINRLASKIKNHSTDNSEVIFAPLCFRYCIQKHGHNDISVHQRLHEASKHDCNPCLCEGPKESWENAVKEFKQQWEIEVNTRLTDTKAPFADVIHKYLSKSKHLIEWRTHDQSSLNVKSFSETLSKSFLLNLMIAFVNVKTPQSEVVKTEPRTTTMPLQHGEPIETVLLATNSFQRNSPIPTLSPLTHAVVNQQPSHPTTVAAQQQMPMVYPQYQMQQSYMYNNHPRVLPQYQQQAYINQNYPYQTDQYTQNPQPDQQQIPLSNEVINPLLYDPSNPTPETSIVEPTPAVTKTTASNLNPIPMDLETPTSCSTSIVTDTSDISDSIPNLKTSQIFARSIKGKFASVEAKYGESFGHAVIVGKKEVIEPLSELKLNNVTFIYEDLSSVTYTDVPILLEKMRKKAEQSDKLKDSVVFLAFELSIITKTIPVSPSCIRFSCKRNIPISKLDMDGQPSTPDVNAFIVKRINEIIRFVTKLSMYVPAVVMPLYPSTIFCDDSLNTFRHRVAHVVAHRNCFTLFGCTSEWEKWCLIVTRLWINLLKVNHSKYISSDIIAKYTSVPRNIFPIKTQVDELLTKNPEPTVWKVFVQTVLRAFMSKGKETASMVQSKSKDMVEKSVVERAPTPNSEKVPAEVEAPKKSRSSSQRRDKRDESRSKGRDKSKRSRSTSSSTSGLSNSSNSSSSSGTKSRSRRRSKRSCSTSRKRSHSTSRKRSRSASRRKRSRSPVRKKRSRSTSRRKRSHSRHRRSKSRSRSRERKRKRSRSKSRSKSRRRSSPSKSDSRKRKSRSSSKNRHSPSPVKDRHSVKKRTPDEAPPPTVAYTPTPSVNARPTSSNMGHSGLQESTLKTIQTIDVMQPSTMAPMQSPFVTDVTATKESTLKNREKLDIKLSSTLSHTQSPVTMVTPSSTPPTTSQESSSTSKLKHKLGDKIFREYAEVEKKLRKNHENEFEAFYHFPELHSDYEVYYEEFAGEYFKRFGINKGDKHKEHFWVEFWKVKFMKVKEDDWDKKRAELVEEYEKKAAPLSPRKTEEHIATSTASDFSVEGALCLMEKISGKLGMVGPAMLAIVKSVRDLGVTTQKALDVINDPENSVLIVMVVDKLKILKRNASPSFIPTLDQIIDNTNRLIEYAKNPPKPKEHSAGLNLNAIAKASIGKDSAFILNLIKTALAYEGLSSIGKDEINNIFLKVCSMHFDMTMKE